MCVITISLALCESTCPHPNPDAPAGCLRIYPFASVETHCPESDCVLGSCGRVEMFESEGEDGRRVEKRICESCVAWSALMRDMDGRRKTLHAGREAYAGRRHDRVPGARDGLEGVMTPGASSGSSEFEVDS